MPTYQSMAEPTLLPHMSKLSPEDQAIIVNMVRQHVPGYDHLHRGLLPFLALRITCEALLHAPIKPASRCVRIRSKLTNGKYPSFDGAVKTINLHLDDTKVFKRFGVAPERGVIIPNAPKSIGEKNIIISPIMTLRHLNKGFWQVCLLKWFETHAVEWLVDHCR